MDLSSVEGSDDLIDLCLIDGLASCLEDGDD